MKDNKALCCFSVASIVLSIQSLFHFDIVDRVNLSFPFIINDIEASFSKVRYNHFTIWKEQIESHRVHLYIVCHWKKIYNNIRIQIIGNSQDPTSQITEIDVQSQSEYVRSLNAFYNQKYFNFEALIIDIFIYLVQLE